MENITKVELIGEANFCLVVPPRDNDYKIRVGYRQKLVQGLDVCKGIY